MPFAVVLVLLVVGSILFHIFSPWTFTPLASNWGMVDFTVDITLWVTAVVFVSVNLFMAYCVYRFRTRDGIKAKYEPENKKLESWLTGLTAVGVAAMLTPGLFVWAKFVEVPEEAHVVEAVGQQWNWSFRYPGADGKFGQVDSERISADNPLGIDPDDPNGRDDVVVLNPEVHIPVDKPVKFLLRSKDVLHDFAVAQFRVKMDLVPGMDTYLWLTPTKTGRFELLCEELCGIAHHTMRGAVIVDEPGDFDAWLGKQRTFDDTQHVVAGNASIGAAQYAVCAACHGQQAEGQVALNAPKLAGQSDWYLARQINAFKHGLRGVVAEDTYGQQMAPMAATLPDDAAIANVIAHLESLPDTAPEPSISGDVAHGEKLARVCSYCHGEDGMGNQAIQAPRYAGMSDWYLVRQLQHFRDGVRGAHPEDYFGKQMGFMGRILEDDEAINDLVAYINTLGRDKTAVVATARNGD
ncbi:MAG TPA: c-type cytochrome [Woeseiaceae bacterium]|nr:c-type cytochrome [Woeseiaceae bacterium]